MVLKFWFLITSRLLSFWKWSFSSCFLFYLVAFSTETYIYSFDFCLSGSTSCPRAETDLHAFVTDYEGCSWMRSPGRRAFEWWKWRLFSFESVLISLSYYVSSCSHYSSLFFLHGQLRHRFDWFLWLLLISSYPAAETSWRCQDRVLPYSLLI